jgi:hypothetical protein
VNALLAVVLVAALAFVGGGVFLIVERETGTRARATVSDCVERGRSTVCTGTWVVGGSLVGGNGHVVVGAIDGAVSSDVGKTIDVTLSGGRAYVRSLVLPILLIGLGVLLAVPSGRTLIRVGHRA